MKNTLWKNTLWNNQNLKAVGHRFQEINDVPWSMTLREGPETLTQWKSESVTDQQTYLLTGLGSRDASASKKIVIPKKDLLHYANCPQERLHSHLWA